MQISHVTMSLDFSKSLFVVLWRHCWHFVCIINSFPQPFWEKQSTSHNNCAMDGKTSHFQNNGANLELSARHASVFNWFPFVKVVCRDIDYSRLEFLRLGSFWQLLSVCAARLFTIICFAQGNLEQYCSIPNSKKQYKRQTHSERVSIFMSALLCAFL